MEIRRRKAADRRERNFIEQAPYEVRKIRFGLYDVYSSLSHWPHRYIVSKRWIAGSGSAGYGPDEENARFGQAMSRRVTAIHPENFHASLTCEELLRLTSVHICGSLM